MTRQNVSSMTPMVMLPLMPDFRGVKDSGLRQADLIRGPLRIRVLALYLKISLETYSAGAGSHNQPLKPAGTYSIT